MMYLNPEKFAAFTSDQPGVSLGGIPQVGLDAGALACNPGAGNFFFVPSVWIEKVFLPEGVSFAVRDFFERCAESNAMEILVEINMDS